MFSYGCIYCFRAKDPIRQLAAELPGDAVLPRRRGRPGYRPRPPYPLGKAIGTITGLGTNVAFTLSFVCSTLTHYALNRFWALPSVRTDTWRQAREYLGTVAISWVTSSWYSYSTRALGAWSKNRPMCLSRVRSPRVGAEAALLHS